MKKKHLPLRSHLRRVFSIALVVEPPGDVIGFVSRHDKVSFTEALDVLADRAGLSFPQLMKPKSRRSTRTTSKKKKTSTPEPTPIPSDLLSRVVEHYHKTFCQREDAQKYLRHRGLEDAQLVLDYKIGYADGSLLKLVPKEGELREELVSLGVITEKGRELLGGCVVVPIPDPLTGQWVSLYGRGMKAERHCYLPGPFRGIVNYQAAKASSEIVLTESILDALSFQQAGVTNAIPIYGTNGFTPEHLDLLKRESVSRVILALDNDDPGRKATETIKGKLSSAGIAVRTATFPDGTKDANELLVSRNGDAGDVFRRLIGEAESTSTKKSRARESFEKTASSFCVKTISTYHVRVYPVQLGRLRATVKLERGERFHVDTLESVLLP